LRISPVKKGLRIIPLAVESRKALIFIYRPNRLEKDIIREESVSILKECGIALACESVLANEMPGDEDIEKCKALGAALV